MRCFPLTVVSGNVVDLARSLSREIFDTDRGLWLATNEQELYQIGRAHV